MAHRERKGSLATWVTNNAKKLGLSAADVVLIDKGTRGGVADTELLAYAEGFMTEYHLVPATKAGAQMAFFELLGMVETHKVNPWADSEPAVRTEAMARLKTYHATLDPAHRDRWRDWLADERNKQVKNQPGRTEFLDALATFVK